MKPSQLRLLGGFEFRQGGEVESVPLASHRLLAHLALHDRPLPRSYVADSLWPDTSEAKAQANLRTALWRLGSAGRDVLDVSSGELSLGHDVEVDVREVHDAARTYRRTGALPDPELLLSIHGELLPGCWDSWVVFDRERLRLEAVRLLELAGNAAMTHGDPHLGLLLVLGAVECDPLRESSNVLAVRARIASGDLAGAVRHVRTYCRMLRAEIGMGPPRAMVALLESLTVQGPIRPDPSRASVNALEMAL